MRYWFILLAMICSPLFSQEDESLVGDSLVLGTSRGAFFTQIFMMEKTRFPPDAVGYDTLTGKGFHQAFFGKGDFNAGALDSTYSEKAYPLLSIELLGDDQGNVRYVAFLGLAEESKVIWVEIEAAAKLGELMIEE